MISHASKLGQWWKFLAMATLFYAIILRFMMYLLSLVGLKRALKKSFLTLEGVQNLLRDMNEPIISTHAIQSANGSTLSINLNLQMIEKLDSSYDVVQGWAMSQEGLEVLNDSMHVIAPMCVDVGGTNTLREDTEIIDKSKGEVLLYVKAWEPPTMDFMDYLDELLMSEIDKVVVVPVGTVEEGYNASDRFINIWVKKLSGIESTKLWLKR
jgi:hypothetical protein